MAMQPDADCQLCPRLVAHRQVLRAREPGWFNTPVPAFGDEQGWLAIVGLAPGERGANRTGRPFTGDASGELLYRTLSDLGLSSGSYGGTVDDGLTLNGALIVNAVRCLPPANKPDSAEIHQCRPFLKEQLRGMPHLKVVLALGQVAHQSALKALGGKLPKHPFGHGAVHRLHTGYTLVDSYHCSRYNQNTGRLTGEMFREAVKAAIAARA
ncbi:uracil-DNA glycosylase [Sandaracinobacter neustonicus]|nr:uracil-DNA glycosylase [Sandaracinobacter neustonicus]